MSSDENIEEIVIFQLFSSCAFDTNEDEIRGNQTLAQNLVKSEEKERDG
jgi:hypothetical protein